MVAYNYAMKHVFNIKEKDVMFSSSDIGWIVGHNFIVYCPLLRGAATVVYEGKPVGTPNPGVMWKLIQEYKVNAFYIAPTAVRAIKKEDLHGDWVK